MDKNVLERIYHWTLMVAIALIVWFGLFLSASASWFIFTTAGNFFWADRIEELLKGERSLLRIVFHVFVLALICHGVYVRREGRLRPVTGTVLEPQRRPRDEAAPDREALPPPPAEFEAEKEE